MAFTLGREQLPHELKRQAVMGPTIVGSYQTVADYFDRIADQTQVEGVLLTFPEFITGVTQFGEQVMPRMRGRLAPA